MISSNWVAQDMNATVPVIAQSVCDTSICAAVINLVMEAFMGRSSSNSTKFLHVFQIRWYAFVIVVLASPSALYSVKTSVLL